MDADWDEVAAKDTLPERAKKLDVCGDIDWVMSGAKESAKRGKSSGFRWGGQAGEMSGKVAKNETFGCWNGAEKCHLSADKVTK